MASVTFTTASYTYTVTVPTSAGTITPQVLGRGFTNNFTPSITLNKALAGAESVRYLMFSLKSGTKVVAYANYHAIAYKGQKTYYMYKDQEYSNEDFLLDMDSAGWPEIPTTLVVTLYDNSLGIIGQKTVPFSILFSGFTPSVSISPTITSNINAQFGDVVGFCSATAKANSSGGSWAGGIDPPIISSSLSGNGKSTTTINGTLNLGTLNSTSVPVTATVKNKLNGTKTASITLTAQAYSKPTIGGLSLSRGTNDYADIQFDYALHSLNKASNETANITAGNATGYWKILDSNGNQVYPVSGWASSTIVSDGNTLANTSDTITESIPEELKSDQSYTLVAYVEDRLGQVSPTMSYVLPTEYRTLDFLNGGKGVAFGKVSEHDGLDINMDVFCKPLVGSVQMFAGMTAPNGWFLCDGAPKSVQDYPELFAVIGHTFGGSGNTFNLPDIRGRMPVGAGQGSGLTNRPLADKKGSEGIQEHNHGFTDPTITRTNDVEVTVNNTNSAHSHALNRQQLGITTGSTNRWFASGTTEGGSTTKSGEHTHGASVTKQPTFKAENGAVDVVSGLPSGQTTGDSGNMPPYLGINFIIHAGVPTV